MRFLALMNAHSLAHVARVLEVSKELRGRGHQVIFAGHGQQLAVAKKAGFEVFDIPYISIEHLEHCTNGGKLSEFFSRKIVDRALNAELNLIDELKPDALIADNRVTATTAAEISGLKIVNIVNVHMSVYKKLPFYSLSHRFSWLPNLLMNPLNQLQNKIECYFFDKFVMKELANVRTAFGLKPKYSYSYEVGDLTLFADIPIFNPVSTQPSNSYYVGPLVWHNDLSLPEGLIKQSEGKKLIYIALGSLGNKSLLQELKYFSKENYQFIVTSSGEFSSSDIDLPENIMVVDYISMSKLLPHCDLVVCHGGNGTIYSTLMSGVPMVGVANHQEQYYGIKRLRMLGAGVGFMKSQLSSNGGKKLCRVIERVLSDQKFKISAEILKREIQDFGNPAKNSADRIEEFFEVGNRTHIEKPLKFPVAQVAP